jgi:DNA end-binding protein Ku
MRAVWKGVVSFGLVTIPVKLYAAAEPRDSGFHQVHAADGARIKLKRVCTQDGQETPTATWPPDMSCPTGA